MSITHKFNMIWYLSLTLNLYDSIMWSLDTAWMADLSALKISWKVWRITNYHEILYDFLGPARSKYLFYYISSLFMYSLFFCIEKVFWEVELNKLCLRPNKFWCFDCFTWGKSMISFFKLHCGDDHYNFSFYGTEQKTTSP